MSVLTDVKALLSGSVSNIYIGEKPTSPDSVVALYNAGGYPRSLSGNYVSEPTIMIHVRDNSYAQAENICETIKNLLHGVHENGKIMLIEQQGDVLDLGRDENNRAELSINFRLYYR